MLSPDLINADSDLAEPVLTPICTLLRIPEQSWSFRQKMIFDFAVAFDFFDCGALLEFHMRIEGIPKNPLNKT